MKFIKAGVMVTPDPKFSRKKAVLKELEDAFIEANFYFEGDFENFAGNELL